MRVIREQRTWQAPCVCMCVWIDRFRFRWSSIPSHPIHTHADAPPLESDDDDEDENVAAAAGGATAEDDEEGGDGDGTGGGGDGGCGGGGGVRFVAEYEDGTMEELHAPPPDMAAEVGVGVYMQYCVSRCGMWERQSPYCYNIDPIYQSTTQTFTGHAGEPVYAVAISPTDPRAMLTGGGDDRAFLWHAASFPLPSPSLPPPPTGACVRLSWCLFGVRPDGWSR